MLRSHGGCSAPAASQARQAKRCCHSFPPRQLRREQSLTSSQWRFAERRSCSKGQNSISGPLSTPSRHSRWAAGDEGMRKERSFGAGLANRFQIDRSPSAAASRFILRLSQEVIEMLPPMRISLPKRPKGGVWQRRQPGHLPDATPSLVPPPGRRVAAGDSLDDWPPVWSGSQRTRRSRQGAFCIAGEEFRDGQEI